VESHNTTFTSLKFRDEKGASGRAINANMKGNRESREERTEGGGDNFMFGGIGGVLNMTGGEESGEGGKESRGGGERRIEGGVTFEIGRFHRGEGGRERGEGEREGREIRRFSRFRMKRREGVEIGIRERGGGGWRRKSEESRRG
jgi:hypothetical protein